MQALIATLIAALAAVTAATTYELSADDLNNIQARSLAQTDKIASLNRGGTLAAATVKWQLDNQTSDTPTPEQLVATGYLANTFLAQN